MSSAVRTEVAIFSPSRVGGLAEHTHYQATALKSAGIDVNVLTCAGYLDGRPTVYVKTRLVPDPIEQTGTMAKLRRLYALLSRYRALRKWCHRHHCPLLLLDSFTEYFSPLWRHEVSAIANRGTLVGANLHDPLRDYRIGPAWWHNWSVKLAYRDLDFVLCHQRIGDEANIPSHVKVFEVPVGIYTGTSHGVDMSSARAKLGIPNGKRVFLAFGFIRDNKNLDLSIRALAEVEDACLIVAGRPQSSKDRPLAYYERVAKDCGVQARVRFDSEFIADDSIPLYFSAANVVLLTYSSAFHSQSGVLNVAAKFRKPVLASSGESPLKDCVQRFGLGRFVEPDRVSSLASGYRQQIDPATCDWGGYSRYATWETNVAPIISLLKERPNRGD